ncbi:MAG: hypothetical protein LBO74_03345 [Candidatus Symbiothrix sp.]|jgi:hypothetical protein|nr:hypothetical protein [Candidatus Symbiothrix sp.]
MKNTINITLLLFLCLLWTGCNSVPVIDDAEQENRLPQLFPDYTGIVIPPNLAPLNFEIKEAGDKFLVQIVGEEGETLNVYQSSPKIQLPPKAWKTLLQSNKNRTLSIHIFIRKGEQWHQFQTIQNSIAEETINPYLYYRDIVPTNGLWNYMAMHQRNLENFTEEELFTNYRIDHNCMNCHTFNRNNPHEWLFHVRGSNGGTVICKDDAIRKMVFPLPEVLSAGAYCNWHPDGKKIAFAVNQIKQNYYLSGYADKMKEVFDLESDIVIYDTETNTISNFPQIASPTVRENLPVWSADGKMMYFVSATAYEQDMPNEDNVYSLMQVTYHSETNQVGEPELLIASEEIGGSIAFPTVSPDGRFMLFCVADFGYFPVNNKSADIYIMDLQTKAYHKAPINSPESESYISWSDNSRWFVFSSRRLDGMTSKPFICHINAEGTFSKPFIIPQKEADYYTIDHRNFSRPELLSDRVSLNFGDLQPAIFGKPVVAGFQIEQAANRQ